MHVCGGGGGGGGSSSSTIIIIKLKPALIIIGPSHVVQAITIHLHSGDAQFESQPER